MVTIDTNDKATFDGEDLTFPPWTATAKFMGALFLVFLFFVFAGMGATTLTALQGRPPARPSPPTATGC
ncbi:MAG TPA: hypothetical protein VH988_20025 [Thermoanaerobaculia bacterium]|jgi:hypothetical protein|nr:hypothetical protein [Thermoanaerobaculia bacterium]